MLQGQAKTFPLASSEPKLSRHSARSSRSFIFMFPGLSHRVWLCGIPPNNVLQKHYELSDIKINMKIKMS